VDTQDDDDDEQKVEGGSVREAVLTNLCSLLNQLQPTYVRCPEGKPSWPQTACLIKAGTLLNIWLYFHHGTHA
jgi:hypothetical protein